MGAATVYTEHCPTTGASNNSGRVPRFTEEKGEHNQYIYNTYFQKSSLLALGRWGLRQFELSL